MARAGAVVAAANEAGANQVYGPNFTLSDPDAPIRAARARALAEAKRQAASYAAALGLRVERVVRVSETGAPSDPIYSRDSTAYAPLAEVAVVGPPVRAGVERSAVTTHVDFVLGPK